MNANPQSWTKTRLRYASQINPSKAEVRSLPAGTEVSFLPMEAVGEDGTFDLSETRSIDDVTGGYTYFRDGDVLVAKITPCFENGKAALVNGLRSRTGFGSTEFHVLRARSGLLPKFLFYVTRSRTFMEQGTASMYGAGGQKRVPTEFLKDFQISVPTLAEQQRITEFLDRETARIDALTSKQEAFASLLDKQRRAIISFAVTGGAGRREAHHANAGAALASLPTGWVVKRLKHLAAEVTVGVVVTPSRYYADTGIPALRSLNIRPMEIVHDDLVFFDETSNRLLSKSMIRTGDLVAIRTGKPGTTAVVGPDLDGANCIDLILIRRSPRFDSRFMAYVMNSDLAHAQYAEGSEGAIQQHFNIETAKNLLVPAPPIAEQKAIAMALDTRLARHGALRARATEMIERLREHRAAVITAAVTGGLAAARFLTDRGPSTAQAA